MKLEELLSNDEHPTTKKFLLIVNVYTIIITIIFINYLGIIYSEQKSLLGNSNQFCNVDSISSGIVIYSLLSIAAIANIVAYKFKGLISKKILSFLIISLRGSLILLFILLSIDSLNKNMLTTACENYLIASLAIPIIVLLGDKFVLWIFRKINNLPAINSKK